MVIATIYESYLGNRQNMLSQKNLAQNENNKNTNLELFQINVDNNNTDVELDPMKLKIDENRDNVAEKKKPLGKFFISYLFFSFFYFLFLTKVYTSIK